MHPGRAPISRQRARKAVLSVKAARDNGGASNADREIPPSVIARYLGYFGTGPAPTVAKKTPSARKSAVKKATARKSARKAS